MKETLKALREKFNYSQNSVARFLGISRQMYIKYESGDVEPPVKVVAALSGLYKVPYEVIIDNRMLNHQDAGKADEGIYHIHENPAIQVADPGVPAVADPDVVTPAQDNSTDVAEPAAVYSADNLYADTIVGMFRKLIFAQQIKVFAELAGEIQKHGDEIADSMLETKKEKDPLQQFFELGDSLHGNSKGWKWNREELYDREICKHRGE